MDKAIKEFISRLAELLYIIFMLIIAYQIIKAIIGGTWETENIMLGALAIIMAGIFAILTALISQGSRLGKLEGCIDEHLRNHK